MSLSPTAQAALASATCTRGPNKGRLLKAAPPSTTLAYAAWQGAMMVVNPYKVSLAGLMFMSEAQLILRAEVARHFKSLPKAQRISYDKDRATLEACGVW
jgi:hypothetical protein